ncbi:hypothetical protein BH10ACI3_BH10ACI3_06970 [soil metagenome]
MLLTRIRIHYFNVVLFLLLFGFGIFLNAQENMPTERISGEELRTTIEFCNHDVTKFWKQANSSFYITYSFSLDDTGKAVSIKKLRDEVVGEKQVKACFSKWTLNGFKSGTNFIVTFKWRHGKGWVEQDIVGGGMRQIVTIDGIGY